MLVDQRLTGAVLGMTLHTKPEENKYGVQFSQSHAFALVDINGDGLMDFVTGKRFWAHGPKGDKEPDAAPVVYWFELKRANGKAEWLAHLIDDASGFQYCFYSAGRILSYVWRNAIITYMNKQVARAGVTRHFRSTGINNLQAQVDISIACCYLNRLRPLPAVLRRT